MKYKCNNCGHVYALAQLAAAHDLEQRIDPEVEHMPGGECPSCGALSYRLLTSAAELDAKYNQDGNGEHHEHTRINWRNEVAQDRTLRGYWEWAASMIEREADDVSYPVIEASKATSAVAQAAPEYFPGACVEKIGSLMMQDVVGDYDTPCSIWEWTWIEQVASFKHAKNGVDGIWDLLLNLSLNFENIPEKLKPVLAEAKSKNLAFLWFHQGT